MPTFIWVETTGNDIGVVVNQGTSIRYASENAKEWLGKSLKELVDHYSIKGELVRWGFHGIEEADIPGDLYEICQGSNGTIRLQESEGWMCHY